MKRACTKYRNLIAYRDIFTLQLKQAIPLFDFEFNI